MLELRYEPESQKQAFVEACAWAEDIYICVSWIEPGDAQGPSYADLKPHEGKLRQAIVGLARLQSYPVLLRRLHRASVLRLVSTLDGSFSPNCYLFRNGTRWRVLLASAPFTSTRFARPCESLVVFEGDRDDPFTLRALQLLDRCRAAAHVSTGSELDTYEAAWAEARTGGRTPDMIAGLPLETHDVSAIGVLTLITDATAARTALVDIRDSLSAAATLKVSARVLPCRGEARDVVLKTTLYWSSLGLWAALHRGSLGFGLHFGFLPPWEVERPIASLSLLAAITPASLDQLIAADAIDAMAMGRAEDGRRFLFHMSGESRACTADLEVRDGSTTARGSVIGEVGAADFVQTAGAFAFRLSRRRIHDALEIES